MSPVPPGLTSLGLRPRPVSDPVPFLGSCPLTCSSAVRSKLLGSLPSLPSCISPSLEMLPGVSCPGLPPSHTTAPPRACLPPPFQKSRKGGGVSGPSALQAAATLSMRRWASCLRRKSLCSPAFHTTSHHHLPAAFLEEKPPARPGCPGFLRTWPLFPSCTQWPH